MLISTLLPHWFLFHSYIRQWRTQKASIISKGLIIASSLVDLQKILEISKTKVKLIIYGEGKLVTRRWGLPKINISFSMNGGVLQFRTKAWECTTLKEVDLLSPERQLWLSTYLIIYIRLIFLNFISMEKSQSNRKYDLIIISTKYFWMRTSEFYSCWLCHVEFSKVWKFTVKQKDWTTDEVLRKGNARFYSLH